MTNAPISPDHLPEAKEQEPHTAARQPGGKISIFAQESLLKTSSP